MASNSLESVVKNVLELLIFLPVSQILVLKPVPTCLGEIHIFKQKYCPLTKCDPQNRQRGAWVEKWVAWEMLGVKEWYRKSAKSTDNKIRTRDSPMRAKECFYDV